ncbi:MAG TPA: hypothetical protein VE591_08210 [Candidatus Acidoferrum sp.]|jgi:hypothetical protein|nr:hypothetical protein [Candidatus Acidoferrum sp.]
MMMRTGLRLRRCSVSVACALVIFAQPSFGAEHGYDIWFSGRVLSVDHGRGVVRIARGPTETAGPAVEVCALKRRALNRLRPGMQVEAQADTRRRPWKILHLRIFQTASSLRA